MSGVTGYAPGGEVIDLLGALRGGLDASRRSELLDRFQLDPTKKCRAYSKGNRQKVALVAAFASDVELYLLDEPTSGLDPLMETVFQDVVRGVREQGRTVLLSSHILAEVEALCDRVTIIRDGRAAESGTFDELRHLTRTTVVVQTARPVESLARVDGVHDVHQDATRAEFSVDAAQLNAVLGYLVDFDVRSMTSSPPTLEELFLRHYGDQIAAPAPAPESAHMFVRSLQTHADAVQEVSLPANNPGLRMLGLASGPSVGGATMIRDYVTLAVLAALMSTLAVVRHTRQSEELGRAEMVGATVVGRYAELAAAVLVAVAANLLLLGLAMIVNGQPAAGSFTAGAAVAAVGVAFVGVAAVTAQLASTSRGATGVAGAVLGLSFLLGGIGNMLGSVDSEALRVTSAWPAWLSPIGWGQQMRPFGGDHWWPLVLFAALFVCLLAVSVLLVGRRDVGRGVWPERRGEARAARSLLSSTGLAWRLQRGALAGWAVGMLGFGLIFGAMTEQIQDVQGNALEWYRKVGGTGRIVDAYQASMVEMAGMAAAIYVVQILLRMRSDEAGGTLEAVLATGVSRSRWIAGHVLNAVAGAVLLMLVFSVSMGLTAGQALGDTGAHVRAMTAAGLVQLPAIAVVGAVVVAAVGLLPRWATPVSWAWLLATVLLGPTFGESIGLPAWVQDVSPFTHVPNAPATDVTATPLVVLTAACLGLAAVGALAIRRRNLVLPA